MSPYKNVSLRKGKTESLQRFHPWIFSGALLALPAALQEGELVRVLDHQGRFVAVGHYQIGSIAVRVLSFRDEPVDAAFWERHIAAAYRLRCGLGLVSERNNTFRLVHGEGDGLPGLIIDVYGRTAVMQAHSVGMHLCRHEIAEALMRATGGAIDGVYYKSETTLPFKAALSEKEGLLLGTAADSVALEQGLRFRIDWLQGQKTGFFVDQRENRALVERYAAGRNVLNMFCYTGGFSVYALRGGARRVCSVDSSGKAVAMTSDNVELNFTDDVASRHEAVEADAFKFLEHSVPGDYDLVILDPPAFAKHRGALRNALKGYTRLNALGISKVKSGGLLFTFSCSQAVSTEQFRLAVFTAAAQTRRTVRILHQLHQPADHPVNIYHPEGEYLKGLVLEVE